ncbi:hypothetical protein DI396_15580 [Litorivita pollutaquae]|uniref:Uncharacterized protein n=2 Tax=Litorivita pollutaquae TaxID=2200892 RepID=A0A2V4NJT5_9RHOB|nr:hypothetical protein DI396_15580 [Litorivita pollutaquae]
MMILSCCIGMVLMTTQTTAGTGNDNPTLAFNLSGIASWNSAQPFLDLMKTMYPWVASSQEQWGAVRNEELLESGLFDDDGWPTEIPDGLWVQTTFGWTNTSTADAALAEQRSGVYVLDYEGTGTITLSGDATILSEEDGKIVFENTSGNSFSLKIMETDLSGSGDYIRDISIVPQESYDLYQAGATFNPDWIELIGDARQIRFMNWMQTNNSEVTSWDDAPDAAERGFTNIASVEDMVQLANEVGADPWFNMPHLADDDYIRQFATYVRDNLDPSLEIRIEYSNEIWNLAFDQSRWLKDQSIEEWGSDLRFEYYTKMSVNMVQIWNEVFGDEAEDRLVPVLGTQTANAWVTEQMLTASTWAEMEPDAWVNPTTLFDEIAITNYFGGATARVAEMRSELLDVLNDRSVDATDWLFNKLLDPEYQGSIPFTVQSWQAQKDLAEATGLDLVAYEGGQHVQHSFAVQGMSDADLTQLTEFLAGFVRSEEMAELYQVLWDAWTDIADGAFMQFTEASVANKWGSWGLYASLLDENPRADLLEELNEVTEAWWDGAEAGDQYLQGIVVQGTDASEVIVGTAQEDYLTGGRGNDVFIAGAGDDGMNGGDGHDTVRLSGTIGEYALSEHGDGYLLEGTDGTDYLFDIEALEFEVGGIWELADGVFGFADPTLGIEEGSVNTPHTTVAAMMPMRAKPSDLQAQDMVDASEMEQGMQISRINPYSALGQSLGDAVGETYFFAERDATIDINGESIGLSYWSINMDLTDKNGDRITGDAQQTAELLGDLIEGAQTIFGSDHDDAIYIADSGAQVYGGEGNDKLVGSVGDDMISGDDGDDYIVGGSGNNMLIGGLGRDTFVVGNGQDEILDFTAEDRIRFGDFFGGEENVADYAVATDTGLEFRNGDDSFMLVGLGTADLDWIF